MNSLSTIDSDLFLYLNGGMDAVIPIINILGSETIRQTMLVGIFGRRPCGTLLRPAGLACVQTRFPSPTSLL